MAMPDFSFLQNQQGNTSFGDLAKGLAQGAQLGMNIQNMKLQQATQKQSFQLEQMKYATEQIAEERKQQFLGRVAEATAGKPPLDAARIGAGMAAEAGYTDQAVQFSTVYKNLSEGKQTEPKAYAVDTTNAEGKPVKVWVKDVKDSDEIDPALEKLNVNIPGGKLVSVGGDRPTMYDPAMRLMPKWQEDLTKSREKQRDIESSITQLKQLIPQLEGLSTVGPLEPIRNFIAQTADMVGFPLTDADRRTAANAGSDRLAVLVMKMFGGSDTEKEFGWGRGTLPNLLQDEVGRMRVMTDLLKFKQREADIENLFEKSTLQQMSTGVGSERTSKEMMDEYNKANPFRTMDSPLKMDLIERGAFTPEQAAVAEERLKMGVQAFPKRKAEYVKAFALKHKYIPTGY